MKGLLVKDLQIMRQLKLFLIVMIFMLCIRNSNMYAFAIIYSVMMPFTVLAYDERSKWDKYEVMLPISPFESVFEKYLIGYIGVFCMSLLALAIQPLASMITGTSLEKDHELILVALASLALIMEAVYMPFILKMGVEKARFLFIICIASVGAISYFLIDNVVKAPISISFTFLVMLLFSAAVVINIISVSISIKIRKNKQV